MRGFQVLDVALERGGGSPRGVVVVVAVTRGLGGTEYGSQAIRRLVQREELALVLVAGGEVGAVGGAGLAVGDGNRRQFGGGAVEIDGENVSTWEKKPNPHFLYHILEQSC